MRPRFTTSPLRPSSFLATLIRITGKPIPQPWKLGPVGLQSDAEESNFAVLVVSGFKAYVHSSSGLSRQSLAICRCGLATQSTCDRVLSLQISLALNG